MSSMLARLSLGLRVLSEIAVAGDGRCALGREVSVRRALSAAEISGSSPLLIENIIRLYRPLAAALLWSRKLSACVGLSPSPPLIPQCLSCKGLNRRVIFRLFDWRAPPYGAYDEDFLGKTP